MFVGHSKGLALLFMTEMWERFSFYTMRALLILYMVYPLHEGGLAWSKEHAIELYGLYIGGAYITPIVGGYLSDVYLGQKRSAILGAIVMAFGHFLMAFKSTICFFIALCLIAIGNGFFKPCLTSILGQLYEDKNESQRDAAYSIFYMGINLGAVIATLVSGLLMVVYGFHAGFFAAGVGMVVGLALFAFGKEKYLHDVGNPPLRIKSSSSTKVPLEKEEGYQWSIVFVLFFITIFFIAAWEQMGGLIPLFIDESVDRSIGNWTIPTPWLANLNPLFIITFSPLLSKIWLKLGEKDKDPFIGAKMGWGCLFLACSFFILVFLTKALEKDPLHLPHWGWIVINQVLIVFGELCVIPISWAAVSTLAPARHISKAMGVMLLAIGLGSWLAGFLGSYVDRLGELFIFYLLQIGLIVLAIFCFTINPFLKKMERKIRTHIDHF